MDAGVYMNLLLTIWFVFYCFKDSNDGKRTIAMYEKFKIKLDEIQRDVEEIETKMRHKEEWEKIDNDRRLGR